MKDTKTDKEEVQLKNEIDAIELFFVIKEHWTVLFRTIFIMVAIGFTYAYYKSDTYKAEVLMMVSSSNISSAQGLESSDVSLNQKLVSTYTEIARSVSIMKNVAQKLDLENSPESLAGRVRVSPVGMTELIKISYYDENPQKSSLVVNQISEEFIVKIKSVMSFDNLKIIENAGIPLNPEPKGTKLIVIITGMIGLILGVLEVLWREYYQNKLKNPEDIERILGCQLLASIPDYYDVKLDKYSDKVKKSKKIKVK
jgi:capsular polysaccharide biosynthesis protein